MITAWRIVKRRHSGTAFDGEGARQNGGRWNSSGTAMIYVACTPSLAVLEMAVHLDRATLLNSYVLIRCEFEEDIVIATDRGSLPRDWRDVPGPHALAAIGDRWVNSGRSAVLSVPSAIIEQETNYLLNPVHPDFSRITVGSPEPFEFDPRLIK